MSSDEVVLRVRHVSKRFEIYDKPRHRLQQMLFGRWRTYYREFWALRDIDFEVRKGECVGIIGRNGAGKSTLLQIVTGTLQPTEGSVESHGRIAALLELGSGFNPEFTGKENVYMNAAILGLTKAETDAKYDDIVAFADIGEFIDQPVKTYSSGMMVRLAFAVNAFVDPDILIVDEALAVGDALFQKRCFNRINDLISNGTTLLFVTHDMEIMRTLTRRAILLKNGEQYRTGPSNEILLEYRTLIQQEEEAMARRTLKPGEASNRPLTNKTDKGFGNMKAEVLGAEVLNASGEPCAYFAPGDRIRIRVNVAVHETMDHLNVNIRIRNKEGLKLYSAGTLNDDIAKRARGEGGLVLDREFKAGTKFALTFELECNLGSNFYEIQASILREDRMDFTQETTLHWIDEAAFFHVQAHLDTYFFGGCADLKMHVKTLETEEA